MKLNRFDENASLLIVDDDALICEVLKTKLERSGYEVEIANNGMEALESIKTRLPDLVVLDVNMPKMDGYEVCRRLREDETTRALPVLMITAYGGLNHVIKGLETGADDYVTKPFEIEEVTVRIRSLLRTRYYEKELREKETQLARISTTSQLMVTMAHHINNSLAIISGRAQASKADNPIQTQKLISACLKESKRIGAVIKSLEEVASEMNFNTTAYAGVEDAMIDIEDDLTRRIDEALEEEYA